MQGLADQAYLEIIGKKNVLPSRSVKQTRPAPVVAATTAGMQGFWSLASNDPDLTVETMDKIAMEIRLKLDEQKRGLDYLIYDEDSPRR